MYAPRSSVWGFTISHAPVRQQNLQVLQKQQTELEHQYEFYKARFDQGSTMLTLVDQLEATRRALAQENRDLTRRKNEFLMWEYRLKALYDNELQMTTTARVQLPLPMEDPLATVVRASGRRPPLGAYFKTPLTTADCNEITSKVYAEIQEFTQSEHFASTGSSVFGWSDRRRVDKGLVKFSLEKQFKHKNVDDITFKSWALNRSPAVREQMLSQYMNMQCDLVQEVDFNNVVMYQELQVKKRMPNSDQDVIFVVRSLMLVALLETVKGYIILYYSLDPNLLVRPPDSAAASAPAGTTIHYDWLPTFRWCTAERTGENGEHCVCTYVGAIRLQDANDIRWAVEVLLQTVRWENHVIGPLMTLSHNNNENDTSDTESHATSLGSTRSFDW